MERRRKRSKMIDKNKIKGFTEISWSQVKKFRIYIYIYNIYILYIIYKGDLHGGKTTMPYLNLSGH